MTADDLDAYVGLEVELQLSSGETLAGRLVADPEETEFGAPYLLKSLHESPTPGVSEPTYAPVPSAAAVEWARPL